MVNLKSKMSILGELIAKIGYLRPILASRAYLWPIFLEYAIGIVPQGIWRVLEFKKLDYRGLKGQFDVEKANFRELIVKISHYRPISTSRHHP